LLQRLLQHKIGLFQQVFLRLLYMQLMLEQVEQTVLLEALNQ
jgi:hypothetical protein